MNNHFKFQIKLLDKNLDNLAPPPEDTLGDFSKFELGLRRFCYECDRKVLIRVGQEKYFVFFDPDISLLLEDDFPELIAQLELGNEIELEFSESCWLIIQLVPVGNKVKGCLREFGYSTEKKLVPLKKQQVLDELKRFLTEIMDMAVNTGYVSWEDKEEFIKPAFCQKSVLL